MSENERHSRRDGPPLAEEADKIEERTGLRTPVIYEIVRRQGEEEMARPATSLWWSGVAAGLSISFSLLAQAILRSELPDAPWRDLVSSLGYVVGFLMVVLGRQQLFTENTITMVLPVMADFNLSNLGRMARTWAIVLVANIAGTLLAALFCTYTPVLAPQLLDAMLEISLHAMGHDWAGMFFKGISAGFIMAAMVWLIPSAEAAQFWVIAFMSYLIAAGEFSHIIAGSVEAFLLAVNGQIALAPMIVNFMVPTLLGNIVGGTALFALLSYAQVMKEI